MEVINMRDKVSKEHNYMKIQQPILQETIHNTSPPPSTTTSPPPTTTTSPPTTTTSPTHEFSFTISLNPNPPSKSTQDSHNKDNNNHPNINHHHHHHSCLTPPPEPLNAIDLSPADDIFFHGHLLPISPRSSINLIDHFTLPMKEIAKDQQNPTGNTSFHHHHHNNHHRNTISDLKLPTTNINQTKPKSKSFSIFSKPMLKKSSLDKGEGTNNNPSKKLKLEVIQLIKRYMNMVKPFMLFSKTKKVNDIEYNRKPHSFSGNFLSSGRSLPVEMNRGGGRRGRFSAPASGTVSPAKSTTSDSTMEELQAAIQAAIAHCKNSIAIEDKVQS